MSLVSNFVGNISSFGFGSDLNKTTQVDLNDKTFAELLQKQMNIPAQEEQNNLYGPFGVPVGLEIQNMDGTEMLENTVESIENKQLHSNSSSFNDMNKDSSVTTSEAVTFFSSLLDDSSLSDFEHSKMLDFVKKHATDLYSKGAGSIVTDLSEFVSDVLNP